MVMDSFQLLLLEELLYSHTELTDEMVDNFVFYFLRPTMFSSIRFGLIRMNGRMERIAKTLYAQIKDRNFTSPQVNNFKTSMQRKYG